MKIDFAVFTDSGDREKNEDSFAVSENENKYCFVLCDGLGGHGKGEIASAYVSQYLKAYYEDCNDPDKFFDDCFDKAQSGLLEEQKSAGSTFEMKTTAVVLSISDNKFRYGHIGDSRLYHFRKNKMFQRTLDHSVPQMLALAGDIKEKHIRNHPDRNRLLRVMGVEWDGSRYELSEDQELQKGDAFLLCSDGFWEPITEKEMCKTLKKCSTAEEWINSMSQIVKKNGAETNMDNYTAIAVICKE